MRKLLTRHNSKRRQYKYQHPLRFQPRQRRSQRQSGSTMSWKSLQAQSLIRPFVLTYWPSWLISRLVLPYTSSYVSQKRQEKHSEMHWLIQNYSWHICQKPLTMTLSLLALNAIMYKQRYLLLSSQQKICFSRITSTIDLCITPDTSVQYALKGYRLIRGLHSASSPKGSSTSSVYHYIGYSQPLQQYTVLMPEVVIHSGKFGSVAESGAWGQKWRAISLMLTHHTTCCLDDRGSTPTGSFPPLCTSASNMLKMMQQYGLSSLRSNHSKGWKITSLTLSCIKRSMKHRKNHCWMMVIVAMRQIQNLKQTCQPFWLINQL